MNVIAPEANSLELVRAVVGRQLPLNDNPRTANALNIAVPLPLSGRADEVNRVIRRREFITLIGGAAAWPLAARRSSPVE